MRLRDAITDLTIATAVVGLALYAIIDSVGYMDAVVYVIKTAFNRV